MIQLTSKDLDKSISKDLSLVYITAVWCGPCKSFSPIVTEISESYKEKINFFKLDADESSSKVEEFGIKSIPTILIFKDGQEIDRLSGVKSKQNLTNIIESKLTDTFNTNEDF